MPKTLPENEQNLVDANNALYGENQELKRQNNAAADAYRELQKAYQELQDELTLTAKNLNNKLSLARAPVAAQMERIKHQNNEMRVSMSRMHRLLKAADLPSAMECWNLTNRWLEASVIEPYLGTAPGVEHMKDVAQS